MEDPHWEVTLRELNAPQGTHHQPPGETMWEMGTPMWMTGRSPFQEGEGGNPEDNHFDHLLPPNQMKDGNPEDNHIDPLLPPNQMKM